GQFQLPASATVPWQCDCPRRSMDHAGRSGSRCGKAGRYAAGRAGSRAGLPAESVLARRSVCLVETPIPPFVRRHG
nr:hypothetical protein [Tanacetum cinerariifolium]